MDGVGEITERVKHFYQKYPYPGLEDKIMFKNSKRLSPYIKRGDKVLFPGCGTGHGMVSLAMKRPDLKVYGMDLSGPSLKIANELIQQNGVKIETRQGNYMEPLPWSFKFQHIILEGTLHHTADPTMALVNLTDHLEQSGLVYINLYGKKYHRRRFEILEMFDLLQSGKKDLEERFDLYRAMQDKMNKKSLKDTVMDLSLRGVWRFFYRNYRNIKNQLLKEADSVPYTVDFKECNQLWIDQFYNPNEKTYDIWDTKELLESAGLQIETMFSLGRINLKRLPEKWHEKFTSLDVWSQYRIMELYYPETGSVALLARKD